jgi:hypothetical protein
LGVPALVWVGATAGPDPDADPDMILVRTDSPLAVACLFHKLNPAPHGIVLTALPGDPASWPVHDQAGQHYLAEVALTWYDDGYWDILIPGQSEQPQQPGQNEQPGRLEQEGDLA